MVRGGFFSLCSNTVSVMSDVVSCGPSKYLLYLRIARSCDALRKTSGLPVLS